jgi:hypothetical protein
MIKEDLTRVVMCSLPDRALVLSHHVMTDADAKLPRSETRGLKTIFSLGRTDTDFREASKRSLSINIYFPPSRASTHFSNMPTCQSFYTSCFFAVFRFSVFYDHRYLVCTSFKIAPDCHSKQRRAMLGEKCSRCQGWGAGGMEEGKAVGR